MHVPWRVLGRSLTRLPNVQGIEFQVVGATDGMVWGYGIDYPQYSVSKMIYQEVIKGLDGTSLNGTHPGLVYWHAALLILE